MNGGVRIGLDVLLKAHQGIYRLNGKYGKDGNIGELGIFKLPAAFHTGKIGCVTLLYR